MKTHGKNAKTAMISKTIVLSLILCLASANGEPPHDPFAYFTVSIDVKSNSHQSIIAASLRRKFRRLHDVEVGLGKQKYRVAVIHTHEPQSQSNFYSILVTRRMPKNMLVNDDKDRSHFVWVEYHGLLSFGRDIEEGCTEIVKVIDANAFELQRRFNEAFSDPEQNKKEPNHGNLTRSAPAANLNCCRCLFDIQNDQQPNLGHKQAH